MRLKNIFFKTSLVCASILLLNIVFAFDYNTNFQETSTDEGIGQSNQGWTNHLIYDKNVGRWYHFFIDSTSDIVVTSSPDGVIFDNKVTIDAGTYDLDDFDVEASQNNRSQLHIAYATAAADFLNYRRLDTIATAPYITIGSEEIPFDSSNLGAPDGNTTDDVAYPRIGLDSNDCVLISFGMEDDSEVTADEWEIMFIKENVSTTCGDGDFDENDREVFIQNVQTADVGFNAPVPNGLKTYGNLDAQLFYIDTDTASAARLLTIYYNGTSQTFPDAEVELDSDVEFATTSTSYTSIIINGTSNNPRIVTFGQDDGTATIDAYILDGWHDTTPTQVETGMNVSSSTSISGVVKTFLDTNAPGQDDILLFGINSTDITSISYVNSSDGGTTWGLVQEFMQGVGNMNETKYLNGEYDDVSCNLILRWYTNTSTPFSIYTKGFNTRNCPCGYDGISDWTIEGSNNCVVNDSQYLLGNDVVCQGPGTFTNTAKIHNVTNTFSNACTIINRGTIQ